jgi:hypothetical protein
MSRGSFGQIEPTRPHPISLIVAPARLSDHSIHAHPQPAGTDALPNQPYVPCCHRNDDCTARVGRGGEKSAAADQPIASTGTEPRENVMGTMMGCQGGRQGCHRRHQSQRNRHGKSFHGKSPLSLHVCATPRQHVTGKGGCGRFGCEIATPFTLPAVVRHGARGAMIPWHSSSRSAGQ